ncbi:MAG: 1-acyl-sn-glycerol-3-phosphate acyltransferase [Candidatus Sericytochromatia bacterium]|nr:1-acyl-sn-glycerol-3-phosphate acyltransferase [Candidatus Tanganyikabacteria bacterium]
MSAAHFLKYMAYVWPEFVRRYVAASRAGHSEEYYSWATRDWAQGMMRAARIDVHLDGVDRIGPGPYLIAPNHQSYLDPPALMAVMPGRPIFVMKRELLSWPFFGRLLRGARMIAIDRGNRQQAITAIENALKRLQPGEMVYMFPEGTRSRDGRLGKVKRGVFYFAVHTNLPILPVAIKGSYDRLPRSAYFAMNPGPIYLQALEPIVPDPARGDDQVDELQARWERAIREALGENRLPAPV